MAEEKKTSSSGQGEPEVDYKATCENLEKKVAGLQKENETQKMLISEAEKRFVDLKKDIDRSQKTAAKKTQWNPWELVHRSEDGKDRTEVINCGSRGVVIYRMLNGVATCVFVERVKHRCNMNSDGSYVNKFD